MSKSEVLQEAIKDCERRIGSYIAGKYDGDDTYIKQQICHIEKYMKELEDVVN